MDGDKGKNLAGARNSFVLTISSLKKKWYQKFVETYVTTYQPKAAREY